MEKLALPNDMFVGHSSITKIIASYCKEMVHPTGEWVNTLLITTESIWEN